MTSKEFRQVSWSTAGLTALIALVYALTRIYGVGWYAGGLWSTLWGMIGLLMWFAVGIWLVLLMGIWAHLTDRKLTDYSIAAAILGLGGGTLGVFVATIWNIEASKASELAHYGVQTFAVTYSDTETTTSRRSRPTTTLLGTKRRTTTTTRTRRCVIRAKYMVGDQPFRLTTEYECNEPEVPDTVQIRYSARHPYVADMVTKD